MALLNLHLDEAVKSVSVELDTVVDDAIKKLSAELQSLEIVVSFKKKAQNATDETNS